jgi:hypothetical protein
MALDGRLFLIPIKGLKMEAKTFRKILENCLISEGYIKKGNRFFRESDEVLIVVGVQKSSYSNELYINVGYLLKSLNEHIEGLNEIQGDIRTRFTTVLSGNLVDTFNPEKINDEAEMREAVLENIRRLLDGSLTISGLKLLLQKHPVLLYQTKMSAKKVLGFE